MTKDLTQKMEKEVLDLLYDRNFCKEMKIDYCDITPADVSKVREWVSLKYPEKK